MELLCLSDDEKTTMIKALEARRDELDILIKHHEGDMREHEADEDKVYYRELMHERDSFERERERVGEMIEAVDLAPFCD